MRSWKKGDSNESNSSLRLPRSDHGPRSRGSLWSHRRGGQCVPDEVTTEFVCPNNGTKKSQWTVVSLFCDQDCAAFTDDSLGKDQKSGECEPGHTVTVTTGINICCQNGEIVGPAGGSGEGCAEVYDMTTTTTTKKGRPRIVSIHHGAGPRIPDLLATTLSLGLVSSVQGDVTEYCCGP